MILTLIGFICSFIGSIAIVLETISGRHIRTKIYYFVLKGVYEYDIKDNIKKIKLTAFERRFLLWIVLLSLGFILQILDFLFYKY